MSAKDDQRIQSISSIDAYAYGTSKEIKHKIEAIRYSAEA